MAATLTLLGIESSCDDTAAAVMRVRLRDGAPEGPGEILSSVVWGQETLHASYGGVVPEIAARAHAERLDLCVRAALTQAGIALGRVDAIAVTAGPGLIGGVLSGVMLAKGLAFGAGLPFIGVNHLEGHALTPRLTDGVGFPYLLLLVSGGHCQLIAVDGLGDYARLGGTIDDAPGEAFDKTAKHMGLGYPGGPLVEAAAARGDPARFAFPRPLLDRPGCDMSFSGLKTALRRACDGLAEAQGGLREADRADLCAGFQAAAADVLAEKTARAMALFRARRPGVARPVLAVAGGVAANGAIRAAIRARAETMGFAFLAPPLSLCTDNAAMIAWAGAERFARGERSGWDLAARPRWPLDERAAPLLGAGRKGAKA
jgi:N6-L-threonylcarbamoyladenine synthase